MLALLTHVHRKNVEIYGTLHLFQNIVTVLIGLGKNTGTPVYRGTSLVWYVPRHTCPYRGILVFLFLATKKSKISKMLTDFKLKQLQVEFLIRNH